MADIYSQEKRSNVMSKVRSKGSVLEKKMAIALRRNGIKFRSHPRMFGKPDFLLPELKVVLFVDSCFWHGCRKHGSIPKTNVSFWEGKISRNIERDREVRKIYRKSEYRLVRIWEHDLKGNTADMVNKVKKRMIKYIV